MKILALLIVVAWSCSNAPPTYYGIPQGFSCGDFQSDRIAVCISNNRTYFCIADDVSCASQPQGNIHCSTSGAEGTRKEIDRQREESKKQQEQNDSINSESASEEE